MPSCSWTLRTLSLNIRRRPSSRKIISSRLAICRMMKMATGMVRRNQKFVYMLSSNNPPATMKKGR
ncbi:hypothetical protein D3C73_1621300 [compost metagenome]